MSRAEAVMRVTFIVPTGRPAFDQRTSGLRGGAQLRAALFARGLARRPGMEVRAIVCAENAADSEWIDGVEVVVRPWPRRPSVVERMLGTERVLARRPGFVPIGFTHLGADLLWKLPAQLVRALLFRTSALVRGGRYQPQPRPTWCDSDADVIVAFINNIDTADIIAGARALRQPVILCVAGDLDLAPKYRIGSRHPGPYGQSGHASALSLRDATTVVVQSDLQLDLLRSRFHRDGVLIRNPVPQIPPQPEALTQSVPKRYVVWIGRTDEIKRPELCLELARRCPGVPFVLVANTDAAWRYTALTRQATPNVMFLPDATYAACDQLIRQATVLLNTSSHEGVPNTFLQAGVHSVPVVTMGVNPDGMLTEYDGGIVAGDDVLATAEAIARLWGSDSLCKQKGAALQQYVARFHGYQERIDEFGMVVEFACGTSPRRSR